MNRNFNIYFLLFLEKKYSILIKQKKGPKQYENKFTNKKYVVKENS